MGAFTVFHTGLSLLPVGFGFAALVRLHRLDTHTTLGRWYAGTMIAASVSSFGFLPRLGFTPGQVLTLLTLFLVVIGSVTLRGNWRKYGYAQATALSTSFLLLMVFLTTETLKRFPLSHPYATGPADPSLIPVRLTLLAAYIVGLAYQVWAIRRERHSRFAMVMASVRPVA
jgi:hypothetical protein